MSNKKFDLVKPKTDKSHETSGKLDYYSILKRRKRTVQDFINEHNITNVEQLLNVLYSLNSREFSISEEFVLDTMNIVTKKEQTAIKEEFDVNSHKEFKEEGFKNFDKEEIKIKTKKNK